MTTLVPRSELSAVAEPACGPLERAVRTTLEEFGRTDTPDGAAALYAARLLDEGGHTGASAASLLRELRAAAADATKGASTGMDLVDELRAKRAQRRGA